MTRSSEVDEGRPTVIRQVASPPSYRATRKEHSGDPMMARSECHQVNQLFCISPKMYRRAQAQSSSASIMQAPGKLMLLPQLPTVNMDGAAKNERPRSRVRLIIDIQPSTHGPVPLLIYGIAISLRGMLSGHVPSANCRTQGVPQLHRRSTVQRR